VTKLQFTTGFASTQPDNVDYCYTPITMVGGEKRYFLAAFKPVVNHWYSETASANWLKLLT